jgi:hypothetical protein
MRPWYDAARRYIVNDFNGLSIQENFPECASNRRLYRHPFGRPYSGAIFSTRHHTGAWNVGQINVLMALTDIGLATAHRLSCLAVTKATWFIPRWSAATSKPTATTCQPVKA